MSIFLTGDTHGGQEGDMIKLRSKSWPEGKTLTKDDYLIVLGDFGLVWCEEYYVNEKGNKVFSRNWKEQENQKRFLGIKPWTTLFVDGNHENHDLLEKLPLVDMFGSKVGKVTDSIYHLKRGEVYIIEGKKFFVFGGAKSTDIDRRTRGVSWWEQEVPTKKEFEHGVETLKRYNNDVDYVLTHTCPTPVAYILANMRKGGAITFGDIVPYYLQQFAKDLKFKKWYFGHWHEDWEYYEYRAMYRDIEEIKC